MIFWDKQKFILSWLVSGMIFCGCVPQQETLDLKPHVNKLVLRINELSNQVYDLENHLKRLESRETQIPAHVKRLADLEVKVNRLEEEAHSYFTAEQEGMRLWSRFDQKIQDLRQKLENERKGFLQFQEETGKKFEALSHRAVGLTAQSEGSIPPEESMHPEEPLPPEESLQTRLPKKDTEAVSHPQTEQVPSKGAVYGKSVVDDKSFYEEAYQTFRQEDWPGARVKFQAFLNRYPKSSLADNAQFWIGETFYQQKEYERAILEYEKVIQNYAHEDKLPSALLKQAFSFYAIGRMKEAGILLNQVIKKAPDSEQAQAAKKKLESMSPKEEH